MCRKPKPLDLYTSAISELCDTGDIDVLVRNLHWAVEDISFLQSQLLSLDRALANVEKLRIQVGSLKKQNQRLLQRIREISSTGVVINVSDIYEKSKKDPYSRRKVR